MCFITKSFVSFVCGLSVQGHAQVAKTLGTLSANVHLTNNNGWTACMMAAARGFANSTRTLCTLGSDMHAQNSAGDTAKSIAKKQRHVEVLQVLDEFTIIPTTKGFE